MRQKYIIEKPSNKRLILFFTGWSTDWKIVSDVHIPECYDLLCLWDYRNIGLPDFHKNYDEILIIAWSLGIPVAEKLAVGISGLFNLTGMYAINGSRFPVDDKRGIPEDIYFATCSNLSEQSLKKFRFRIAGGVNRYKEPEARLQSDLTIDDLKSELIRFESDSYYDGSQKWDFAFIAGKDKIFPACNLMTAWEDTPYEVDNTAEHLPDFQRLFNRIIKDKETISKKFSRSIKTYEDTANVQGEIALRMIESWRQFQPSSKNICETGSGSGKLSRLIMSVFKPNRLILIDLSPVSPIKNVDYLCGDAELIIRTFPDGMFDTVCSSSTLQWFHSPGRFLKEVKRVLKPDGVSAISTFLEGTFSELSELTGESLLYLTEGQIRLIAEREGFIIEEMRTEKYISVFDSPEEILRHIKSTGVNSLNGMKKTVKDIKNIMANYPKQDDGRYALTYNSCILILRKPL